MKRFALASAAVSLLMGTAFAQMTPVDTKSSTAAPAPIKTEKGSGIQLDTGHLQSSEVKGITMSESASFAVRFVTPKPANIMNSRLVGLDVYNRKNEKLGQIEDLSIENGKSIAGVIVSVGGFLGMGEKYVVIDPATIAVSGRDGAWKAFVDTTAESLKSAPQFHYGQAKS